MPAAPLYRMAGSYLDYEKLLKQGIPGLRELVPAGKESAGQQGKDTSLFEGMEMALELLSRCCRHYHHRALALMDSVFDPAGGG